MGCLGWCLGPLGGASSTSLSNGLAEFIHHCGSRCGFLQSPHYWLYYRFCRVLPRTDCKQGVPPLLSGSWVVEAELYQVCFWKFSGTKFGPLKSLSRTFFLFFFFSR